MARDTFEAWIADEVSDQVIQAAVKSSAVEQVARPESMSSDTKIIPRTGGFTVGTVAKGTAYSESTATQDSVQMIAYKIGGIERIAEEDLTDTVTAARTLGIKQVEASRALAKFFDNAALGVTAAANGTTIPYTSVYRAVTQADTNLGYTANANLIQTAGAANYGHFSTMLEKVESSDWFASDQMAIIAHPAWKATLRGLLDGNNQPLWRTGMTGGDPDLLWEYPIVWSTGARTSATALQNPAGNPLMIFVNREHLVKGMASVAPGIAPTNPGFTVQHAKDGVGYTTDEALMKATLRRGFVLTVPNSTVVLEKTAS
jgi:HK97 family phage major capsid protein